MSRDSPRRWPGSIYGSGHEPDPRFSLANERTFLAWIRTTIALLAASAAVGAVDLRMSEVLQGVLAAILAIAALLASVQAWRGWAGAERALRHNRPLPGSPVNVILALALVIVAIVLFIAPIFW